MVFPDLRYDNLYLGDAPAMSIGHNGRFERLQLFVALITTHLLNEQWVYNATNTTTHVERVRPEVHTRICISFSHSRYIRLTSSIPARKSRLSESTINRHIII
jgi:hypothetical protein